MSNDATSFTLVAKCPILCHPFGDATTDVAIFLAVTGAVTAATTVALAATIARFGATVATNVSAPIYFLGTKLNIL